MKLNIYIICLSALGFTANAQSPKEVAVSKDSVKIAVAYGQATKQSITYSTSSINSVDLIKNSVYLSGNALYGKLPGLAVLQRTSEPGADAPGFYLRGRSTTKNNSPLVIVDGIERDLNDVQLEDIESITLLKDASAAVIYGIRGANGVINVVTKRGKTGTLAINGKVEQAILEPTRIPEFLNSANYVKLYNQALVNDGFSPLYTPSQIAGYENGDRYYFPDVNWRDEVTNKSTTGTKANVDVSGGDKTATYFVSLGYFNQGGIYKNTDMNEGYSTNVGLENVSFRSNLDLNVNKNWTFGLDLNGRISQKNSPYSSNSTIWDMMDKYPAHLFPVYVQDGVYGGTSVYPNNLVGYVNAKGYRQTNNRVILSTLSTKYDFSDIIKGLTAGMRYSVDNFYSNQEGHTKNFAVRELLGKDAASGKPNLSPAIGINSNLVPLTSSGLPTSDVQNKRNTFEGNLQYAPSLGQHHTLNTQLIYHQDRLTIGNEPPYNYQFLSGRANYGYMNRFFAEIGASYSGTEAFPKGERFGFFPAVSAAWDISQENFLKGNKSINYLKLRVSAGIVGNSAVNERFSNIRQYIADDGYYFGTSNAAQSGLYPGVIANPNFTWETANKYDIGIDARLFKGLNLAFTYFFERRKDILVSESTLVPGIFGGDLPTMNAGITNNKGIEAALSFAKQKSNWGYRTGLNVSYVTDKIEYIPEAVQPYDYLYRSGHRISQPFMLEAIGFFNSTADIQSSPVQAFGPVQPGDIKYKDQNNDGVINNFDEIAMHNTTLPKWDIGFDIGFNFKSFDVSAFFQGQLGRSLYLGNEPLLFWPLTNDGGKISTYANQYWTEQTKATADHPRLTTQENKNNYRESSFWIVNGDFLRLRSLDIGYNLPKQLIKNIKMRNARVFLRGMNLFTVDHLKYTDPEVMAGYPVMKSYNAGISLQF